MYLGGYFVSFMSGNTTRVGVGIAGDDLAAVGLGVLLVGSFVVGAMAGTVIARPGRRHTGILVLTLVVVALVLAAVLALWARPAAAAALAFGMGAVNTTFSKGGEVSFGITYMTGALVKMGQGIVEAFRGGSRTAWLRHLLMWLSILRGASLGALAERTLGESALWFAVGWTAAIAITLQLVTRPRRPTLGA